MLRITAVSTGAVDYLVHGSGCAEHEHAAHRVDLRAAGAGQAPGAEYLMTSAGHGEPAGVWGGRALDMVGVVAGEAATERDVRAVFGRLEHPTSRRTKRVYLGRPPRKFKSREERLEAARAAEPGASQERLREIEVRIQADTRKAVAYYDLTFSPVKSVSVYFAAMRALGRTEDAAKVIAAHRAAVAAAMEFVEREAAYTRTGYHGRTSEGTSVGVYERATGLVWTRWDHSTNRNQEPQLHSHVAVLNRVVSAVTGKIQALDGRAFRPIKAGADAVYRDVLEHRMEATLPVVFGMRPDGVAREILGVDQRAVAAASSRRQEVLGKVEELVAAYEQRHGRAPSAAVRKQLLEEATLATRAAKTTLSPGEQYDRWQTGVGVASAQVTADGSAAERGAADRDGRADHRTALAERSLEQVCATAIAKMQRKYAVWDFGNLMDALKAECSFTPAVGRLVEGRAGGEGFAQVATAIVRDGAVHGVVLVSAPDPVEIPAQLRRDDGQCRFRPHRPERYATFDQLSGELAIVASARMADAPAVAGPALELARVELVAAGLGEDQQAAAVGVLSSGRRGDVLIGPAGTGKSRTVGGLAQVWTRHVGGRVIGVATSQIATEELIANGMAAFNTRTFLNRFTPDEQGRVRDQVRPGDLIVVDEAGMSSTEDLATLTRIVAAGGGKLLFTGDPQQLAAVEAGGMLAMLAHDNGAFALTEVHRFAADWEAAASLRLRDGDPGVLEVYEQHGRLYGGTAEQMTVAATRAWLADTLANRESLLVVGSNEQAATLSGQMRAELVRLGRVGAAVLSTDRDGNAIGVGDRLQARRNNRDLLVEGGGTVTNREVYTVIGPDEATGGLRVRGRRGGRAVLPPDYVHRHVTLAYATTQHAAQGRTVDTCHALIEPGTGRSGVYVPASRGRVANVLYAVCRREPDAHDQERLDSDARSMLAQELERREDGRAAAEMTRRAGETESRSLDFLVGQLEALALEQRHDRYTAILVGLLGQDRVAAMQQREGYHGLLQRVFAEELNGRDAASVLAAAVGGRSLEDAANWSSVLRWRIEQHYRHSRRDGRGDGGGESLWWDIPAWAWQPWDWTRLAAGIDGPVGDYARALAGLAAHRQAEIGHEAADAPPEWALTHLGAPPQAGPDRDEWIARAGIVGAYRELASIAAESVSLGAAPVEAKVVHRALWQRAHVALGLPEDALDVTAASDDELRGMQAAWQRARNFAPYYVAEELGAARRIVTAYEHDLVLWQAEEARMPLGSPQALDTAREIGHLGAALEVAHARVAHLAAIAQVRADWAETSNVLAERHRLATAELARRGRPWADPGEQLALIGLTPPEQDRHPEPADTEPADTEPADTELALTVTPVEPPAAEQDDVLHTAPVDAAAASGAEPALFALHPDPADVAAAGPLHQHAPPTQPEPDGLAPVTLGEARRQLAVIAALRAELTARHTSADPATIWRRRHAAQAQTEHDRHRRDQAADTDLSTGQRQHRGHRRQDQPEGARRRTLTR